MNFDKYTISKKGFWRKSFEVYEKDELKYRVSCPGWFTYHHVIFTNLQGIEVLRIKRFSEFFTRKAELIDSDGLRGEMTKKTFSSEYILKSDAFTYTVNRNWIGDEYTVYHSDEDIAKVSRRMMTNHKQYGVAIIEGNHNLFILGMIICIEIIRMTNNKA